MHNIFGFVYRQNICLLIVFSAFFLIFWSKFASCKKQLLFKTTDFILLVASIAAIAYETLFGRDFAAYKPILIPFYTFWSAQSQPEYYRTFFMNILLFVPIGIFMPYVLSKNTRKRTVFITIVFALLLSATAEFLQYKLSLGLCEIDDVIANTFGAAVGTLSYCLYDCLSNKERKKGSLMQNQLNNTQKTLLSLCGNVLFDKCSDLPHEIDAAKVSKEAKRQTVFPIIYSALKKLSLDTQNDNAYFSQIVAKNMRMEFEHVAINNLLCTNNVPYVILKGAASASYYKEPLIRTMGDIDFLVNHCDIKRTDELLRSAGYITDDDINSDNKHIAYHKKISKITLICEMHRTVNGIPNNSKTEIINKYLSNIFDTSVKLQLSGGTCIVPDKFHHGLILLLHTASHLTHEGVGLRHLCDWAVFVNSIDNNAFISMFEKPLKEMGLWRFAQLLTLCCVEYLGCDFKAWAGNAEQQLLQNIISDILNGGNFGLKDIKRYNQIKYISNRENGDVSKRSAFFELLHSINAKTKCEFSFANNYKLLLPVGWLLTVLKYFYLVIKGERFADNISIINDANKRKSIYSEFKLFDD